jgi:hypothetical protein
VTTVNDENNATSSGSGSDREPAIIHFEATLRPVPGFEYLETVPCGEAEPVPLAPTSDADLREYLEHLKKHRPDEYTRLINEE